MGRLALALHLLIAAGISTTAYAATATANLTYSRVLEGNANQLLNASKTYPLAGGLRANVDLRVQNGPPYRFASAQQAVTAQFDPVLSEPGTARVVLTASPTEGRIVYREGKQLDVGLVVPTLFGDVTLPFPRLDAALLIDRQRELLPRVDLLRPAEAESQYVQDRDAFTGIERGVGIPGLITANIVPTFVVDYTVAFGSTVTALAYRSRTAPADGGLIFLDFATDGSSRYDLNLKLATPGFYDFVLVENVTGMSFEESLERSLGIAMSYTWLGTTRSAFFPVIPVGTAQESAGTLVTQHSDAFDRFFTIEVSAVPEPGTNGLLAGGLASIWWFAVRRRRVAAIAKRPH